jgi:Mg2+-importing ATPase
MFSMAAATLVVPFLPMLPVQVLLNNLLYDISELALPFDRVDEEALARPCVWDVGFVRRSMLTFGPVSSLFDFLTFTLLLLVFHAGPAEFRTGWFVESIATQVLVIFVIRTWRPAYASRPEPMLAALALGIVAFAVTLPLLPHAALLGFTSLPGRYYAVIFGLVATYIAAAEGAKRVFRRRWLAPPVQQKPG